MREVPPRTDVAPVHHRSSVARLIRKERGRERVIEGHFSGQPHRSTYVQIEEGRASLILKVRGEEVSELRAHLPLAHARALLAVSQGQVEYLRTRLAIGSHDAGSSCRQTRSLGFGRRDQCPGEGQDLPAPPWFGLEVSAEPAYWRLHLALYGAPAAPETNVMNVALNTLLDLLEDRLTTWRGPHEAAAPGAPAAEATRHFKTSRLESDTETDEDVDKLGIEDEVIREIARSLQPRHGP